MKINKERISIFAYALLLVSFAANIAAQGGCTTIAEGCCLVTQVGTTSTPDTVPGGLSISSQGCLSLLQTNSNIATYSINQTTCGLEAILPLTPFTLSAMGPSGLSYSPDGNCLLAFDGGEGIVQPFSSSDCILSTAGLPPFFAFNVNSVAISSLKCVTIGTCASPGTGTLVNCNLSITNFPNFAFSKVAYSPNGTCLAAIDCSGNVHTFSVNSSDCTLTLVSSVASSMVPNAVDLAFSPNGSCLVVLSSNLVLSRVSSFSVTGCTIPATPTSSATSSIGFLPTQISFSPDGTCLAVANEANQIFGIGGVLDIYSIDPTNCGLALVQFCLNGETGRAVSWSPVVGSNCLYFVTNGHIFTYSRVPQPVATLSATPSTVCAGGSVTLNAGPTGPGYSYVFSTPNRGMITTPNPTLVIANVTALDSGIYSVVVSLNGCASEPASTSVPVTPLPVATLSATPSTVCAGGSITLNAGPTGPGYSYVFSTPNRGMFSTTTPTLVLANMSVADSGAYSVVVTFNGCASEPASTSVSVTPLPVATLSATPATVCVGSSITLNAGPTGSGYSYVFSTPNRGMFSTTNPTLILPSATVADAGTYSVVVTFNGCASEPASTSVSVIPCNTTLAIFECCSKRISSCDVIDYTISIKNTGLVAASNLQVVDLLPSCLTFLSGSGTGWSFTSSGQTVTATLSNATPLQPGASTTLTIKAKARCASDQKITNQVAVTATNVVGAQTSSCTTKVD